MIIAMRRNILLLLAGLLTVAGFSQDVYIQYDASCMDRLEYAYGFTVPGTEYVKYQVQLNANEYIVLEVGPENSSQVQQSFPGTAMACGNPQLGKELARKIREAEIKAFLVSEQGPGRYAIYRINQASFFRRDAQGVAYQSWQFSFEQSGGLRIGQNLTEDSVQGVNVFFQGPTNYQCAEAYLFRQTFQFAGPNSYREIVFVPGIGIVEERPANGDPNNVYKLTKVNGQDFSQYLQQKCSEGISASPDFLATNNNAAPGGLQPYLGGPPPTGTSNMDTNPSMSPASEPITHTVSAGETLFALSRQYGVGVSDIQQWNDMEGSTTIKVGQVLTVSNPAQTPVMASSYAYKGAASQERAWRTTTGTHTVRAGETLAGLAEKYGYTEARFRDMNGLAQGQTVNPGMVLKTSDYPSGSMAGTSSPSYPGPNSSRPPSPATSRGGSNPQPFVPPTGQSRNSATLPSQSGATAQTETNTQAGIQPFTPPSGNSATLPVQGSSTLPTDSGNPSGIQPFVPPGENAQGASRGTSQPFIPFTPPADSTGNANNLTTPSGNPATLPPPAGKKPSSSFGTPVQTSSPTQQNQNQGNSGNPRTSMMLIEEMPIFQGMRVDPKVFG